MIDSTAIGPQGEFPLADGWTRIEWQELAVPENPARSVVYQLHTRNDDARIVVIAADSTAELQPQAASVEEMRLAVVDAQQHFGFEPESDWDDARRWVRVPRWQKLRGVEQEFEWCRISGTLTGSED